MTKKLHDELFKETMKILSMDYTYGDDSFVNEETDEFDTDTAKEYAKEMISENPEYLCQKIFVTDKEIKPEIIEAANNMLDIAVYLRTKLEGLRPNLKHPEETKKLFMKVHETNEIMWPYWAKILYRYDLESYLWIKHGEGEYSHEFYREAVESGYPWYTSWDEFENSMAIWQQTRQRWHYIGVAI